MYYFATHGAPHWNSPNGIEILLGVMLFCPKCPLPKIDAAMYVGDDRRGD